MTDEAKPCVIFKTGTIVEDGVVFDGSAIGSPGRSIEVKVLVPSASSTAMLLEHRPRCGILTGHETMELCDATIQKGNSWLSKYRLLDKRDLVLAHDWHYCDWGAFHSPSLRLFASFDGRDGRFCHFHGSLIRHGKNYTHPQGRGGSALFAKIVLSIAKQKSLWRPDPH